MNDAATAYPASLQNYLGGAGDRHCKRRIRSGARLWRQARAWSRLPDIHHGCLRKLLAAQSATDECDRIVTGAAQFFAECISPYEMTYRGFREANTALRHFNEVLEQEAKRIAKALHDEAGQLLVAVYIALQNLSDEVPAIATADSQGDATARCRSNLSCAGYRTNWCPHC